MAVFKSVRGKRRILSYKAIYEGVSKSFRTQSITKYTAYNNK